jgi:hypothetical protein
MGQIANLIGGPAIAYKDVAGTLTELGHTKGGIKLAAGAMKYMDLGTDVTGDTVVRRIRNGADPDYITIPFAEESLDTLQLVLDGSKLITDGTTPTKKRVERRVDAGGSPTETKIVIKPIDPATGVVATDKNKWLTIPKAIANGGVEVSYASGEQRVYSQQFECMPEELSAGAGYRTFFFGDSTAVAA